MKYFVIGTMFIEEHWSVIVRGFIGVLIGVAIGFLLPVD